MIDGGGRVVLLSTAFFCLYVASICIIVLSQTPLSVRFYPLPPLLPRIPTYLHLYRVTPVTALLPPIHPSTSPTLFHLCPSFLSPCSVPSPSPFTHSPGLSKGPTFPTPAVALSSFNSPPRTPYLPTISLSQPLLPQRNLPPISAFGLTRSSSP